MRTATMPRFEGASSRHRALFGRSITLLILAGLIGALSATPSRTQAAPNAQATAGQTPSITATGYGTTSVPADRAAVQLLLTEFTQNEMSPTELSPTVEPEGTPTVTEEETDTAAIDLVVAAIAGSGNGITAGDVRVTVSPALSGISYGPEPADTARVDLEVPRPRLDLLNTLVTRVRDAAVSNGLTLGAVGVRYLVDDCATLQRQAEEAAIADARVRAERQAELLGVQLGDVIAATDAGSITGALYYGALAGGTDACTPLAAGGVSFGPGVGVTIPAFDPTAPTDAVVHAQVGLTFAIASAVVGTPSAALGSG